MLSVKMVAGAFDFIHSGRLLFLSLRKFDGGVCGLCGKDTVIWHVEECISTKMLKFIYIDWSLSEASL